MKGCAQEFSVSSWTRISRVIVITTGVFVFGTLVFLWSRAEGANKGPNAACPPGTVIGAPTPVIIVGGPPPMPPTPTPTNRNLTPPLNTPRPAPTAIVFSLAKTIDLDPTLDYGAKSKLYVCKKNGTYILLLARPGTTNSELPFENGDVLFRIDPPDGARKVDVPRPPSAGPVLTRTPNESTQVKP